LTHYADCTEITLTPHLPQRARFCSTYSSQATHDQPKRRKTKTLRKELPPSSRQAAHSREPQANEGSVVTIGRKHRPFRMYGATHLHSRPKRQTLEIRYREVRSEELSSSLITYILCTWGYDLLRLVSFTSWSPVRHLFARKPQNHRFHIACQVSPSEQVRSTFDLHSDSPRQHD